MTIEALLERIAVALENLASVQPPAAEGATAPKARKPRAAAQTHAVATSAAAAEDSGIPATAATASPSEKPLTLDDVRVKLVEVQTKKKSPDAARDLIAKFSKDGVKALSGLDPSNYGKLIAEADKILMA